jgi:hypothetical protein
MVVDPADRLVRGVRAAVLAVPTVGIAAGAHASAGGCAPLWTIALASVGSWPLAYAVLGVKHGVRSLVAWILATQVLTHAVLDLGCTGHHSTDTRMLAAHVLGAVVTATLLARADAGLWLAQALVRGLRPAPVVGIPEITKAPASVVPEKKGKGRWVATQADPRGPPQLLAA